MLLLLASACAHAPAQITVRVNDAPSVTIAAADLAKLPRHTEILNDHGKQMGYQRRGL
jgi:hypothetical protein